MALSPPRNFCVNCFIFALAMEWLSIRKKIGTEGLAFHCSFTTIQNKRIGALAACTPATLITLDRLPAVGGVVVLCLDHS